VPSEKQVLPENQLVWLVGLKFNPIDQTQNHKRAQLIKQKS
jgi:hypothetical protein